MSREERLEREPARAERIIGDQALVFETLKRKFGANGGVTGKNGGGRWAESF